MSKAKPQKPLEQRLTKKLLHALQTRKITNREAAEQLGVSETYLSRKVAAIQSKVPGETQPVREAAHKLFQTRRQFRERLAKKVLKSSMTVTQAAAEANCSERTMFRYVAAYRPVP